MADPIQSLFDFRVPISKKDAKAAGLKRFFDGTPCKQGHLSERHVINGQCISHQTGEFRGWLCSGCNFALGQVNDSPEILEALARYLRQKL